MWYKFRHYYSKQTFSIVYMVSFCLMFDFWIGIYFHTVKESQFIQQSFFCFGEQFVTISAYKFEEILEKDISFHQLKHKIVICFEIGVIHVFKGIIGLNFLLYRCLLKSSERIHAKTIIWCKKYCIAYENVFGIVLQFWNHYSFSMVEMRTIHKIIRYFDFIFKHVINIKNIFIILQFNFT